MTAAAPTEVVLDLTGLVEHVDEVEPCASGQGGEHPATVRVRILCAAGHRERIPFCDPHTGMLLRVFDNPITRPRLVHAPHGGTCGAQVTDIELTALSGP